MITQKNYEVWKNKKIIGHFKTCSTIYGKTLIVPTISEFKRPYGKKIEEIQFPIVTRVLSDNGVDLIIRKCISANHKSKRQIDILLRYQ